MQNCYNTNPRGPSRQDLVEQEERLSRRHLQTLGFTQDLVKEVKALKGRVEELEAQRDELQQMSIRVHIQPAESELSEKIRALEADYNRRMEEVISNLNLQHQEAIEDLVNEKAEAEKAWLTEKQSLQSKAYKSDVDLRETKSECHQLREELEACLEQLRVVQGNLEDAEAQLSLAAQRQSDFAAQMEQLSALKNNCLQLEQDLSATRQEKREVELKLEQYHKDHDDNSKVEKEHLKAIAKLKAESQIAEREIDKLRHRIRELETSLQSAQQDQKFLVSENNDLTKQLKELQEELELSRQQSPSFTPQSTTTKKRVAGNSKKVDPIQKATDISFQEYVSLKREVAALRDENAMLKTRLRSAVSSDIQKQKTILDGKTQSSKN